MFCWLMGFWKKMTDATITMTRFKQLPMECVTGDTRCKIMYDTCNSRLQHKHLPSNTCCM